MSSSIGACGLSSRCISTSIVRVLRTRTANGRFGTPRDLARNRKLAFRLADIGEDDADLIRWRAKEPRELTAEECRAARWLLEAKAVRQWLTKWSYGDSEGRVKIDTLIEMLEDAAPV